MCLERPPLDRVQPNALEKSTFIGEWYYQRTVVDVLAGGYTLVVDRALDERHLGEVEPLAQQVDADEHL